MFCPNKQRSFKPLKCLGPFQTCLESNRFGTAVSNYTPFQPSSEEQVGRVDKSFGSSPDVRAWCRGFEYVSVSPWLLRTVLGYSQPTTEDTKRHLKECVRMTNKQTNIQPRDVRHKHRFKKKKKRIRPSFLFVFKSRFFALNKTGYRFFLLGYSPMRNEELVFVWAP